MAITSKTRTSHRGSAATDDGFSKVVCPRVGSILAAGGGRLIVARQMGGGVDHGGVRKGLRKISEKTLCRGVVFLGEQAEIVCEGKQALEQFYRILAPADQIEAVDEPKA